MTSPMRVRHRARVTEPDVAHGVLGGGPSSCGALLTEMAASPTPNAVSMLNCPGRKSMGPPETGESDSVITSPVSARRSTTR